MKIIKRITATALAAYALIMLGMFTFQRSLLYRPEVAIAQLDTKTLPRAEALSIATPDGETLKVWWIAPQDVQKPVFLYLHGNAGNLDDRAVRFAKMTAEGEGLLAIDWRGYGGSTGSPTEAGLNIDAQAAYDWLKAKLLQISPSSSEAVGQKRIILFGESLGSGVAVPLAVKNNVAAVILDSPFLSILQLASAQYPWLPVSLLLRDPYRTDLAIPSLKAPLLILHGDADPIVPFAHGEALFARANEPKRFHRFAGGNHIVSYKRDGDAVVRGFLREHGLGS